MVGRESQKLKTAQQIAIKNGWITKAKVIRPNLFYTRFLESAVLILFLD